MVGRVGGGAKGVDRCTEAMSKTRVITTRKKNRNACGDGIIVALFCHYTEDRMFLKACTHVHLRA